MLYASYDLQILNNGFGCVSKFPGRKTAAITKIRRKNDELRMCEFETHQTFPPPFAYLTSGETGFVYY
jgi:hypothetical protein